MPKFGVKDLTSSPVAREDLVKAVRDAAEIVHEGLSGAHWPEHYHEVAFGRILTELLSYEYK